MERLTQKLRRMFRDDASLEQRVERAIERMYSENKNGEARKLLTALVALYAGPDNYYINFYGPPGTIQTLPYESLLTEKENEAANEKGSLSDHMVFVGYSDLYDPDQPDRFYTSFTGKDGVDLSGVEIMATAYANLLTQRTLLPSRPAILGADRMRLWAVIGILVYLLPATLAVPAAFALTALYAAALQWRFNAADLWLPLATPSPGATPVRVIHRIDGAVSA